MTSWSPDDRVQVKSGMGWRTIPWPTYQFTIGRSWEPIGLEIGGRRMNDWRIVRGGKIIFSSSPSYSTAITPA